MWRSDSWRLFTFKVPPISVLTEELDEQVADCQIANSFQSIPKTAVTTRFGDIIACPNYVPGYILDPRVAAAAVENDTYVKELKGAMAVAIEFLHDGQDIPDDASDHGPEQTFEEQQPIDNPAKKRRSLVSKLGRGKVGAAKPSAAKKYEMMTTDEKIHHGLTIYMAEVEMTGGDMDLLPTAWWKQQAPRKPVLSAIGPIYTGPPASTAGVERIFSTAGRIAAPVRARMRPDVLRMLVLLKGHMLSARRAAQ